MKEWIPAGGVAAGIFLIYLPHLLNDVSWAGIAGDGGDFLAAAQTGGVAHPSGYPTYTLLLKLFLLLPVGTPYWRGAILSALAAALASGLFCRWIQSVIAEHDQHRWIVGAAAGLTWGTAPLVFAHAVIVEVHALQALLVVLFLWWFDLTSKGNHNRIALALLACSFGLAIGNHLTILLLAPAAVFAIVSGWRNGLSISRLAVLGMCMLAGITVYLYLPLAARVNPPVNWGNPQSWQGFWWTISGTPYQNLVFSTPPLKITERIAAWAGLLVQQFGIPGILLGAAGVVQFQTTRSSPHLSYLLLWIAIAYSIFAIAYRADDSLAYLIPVYLAWSAWIAQGLSLVLSWRFRNVPAGWVLTAVFIAVLLSRIPSTAKQVDSDLSTGAAVFVDRLLQQAPRSALIITTADMDTFPLWYRHFGMNQRTDLRVIVNPLAQYPWYRENVQHIYPNLRYPSEAAAQSSDWVEMLIQMNPEYPLCRTTVQMNEKKVDFQCTYPRSD